MNNIDKNYKGPIYKKGMAVDASWIKTLIAYFSEERLLHKNVVLAMLQTVKSQMSRLNNIERLNHEDYPKMTICGDTHG